MNTPNESTVLVLGIGPLRERFFKVAAARNVRTILVDETAYSRYDSLADENYTWRLTDHGLPGPDIHLLDSLRDRIDGIVSFTEWGSTLAASRAESWQLPGTGRRAARDLLTKGDVRQAMRAAGVPGPAWLLAGDASDATALCGSAKPLNLIVKPVDGAASLGVRRVHDAAGLEAAIREARKLTGRPHALVEEFVEGQENSLEVVVHERQVVRVVVTQKLTSGSPGFIELRHLVDANVPALQHGAEDFAQALVSALGVVTGVLHIEAKWTGISWHLIEVAFRVAGGLISDAVLASTGRDLYDDLLDCALGQLPAPASPMAAQVAGVQFVAGTGTVADAPSMASVRHGLASITRAERLLAPGTSLETVSANWFRAGYVMGVGDDSDVVIADLSEAHRRLADLLGLTPLPAESQAQGSPVAGALGASV